MEAKVSRFHNKLELWKHPPDHLKRQLEDKTPGLILQPPLIRSLRLNSFSFNSQIVAQQSKMATQGVEQKWR